MNANELMIGDLVYSKAKERNVRVKGVRTDCEGPAVLTDFGDVWWRLCEFEPIPLTEEILLENGFKPNRFVSCGYYVLIPVKGMSRQLSVTIRDNVFMVSFSAEIGKKSIDFIKQDMSVHELQHVMRLCGIEKEVVL